MGTQQKGMLWRGSHHNVTTGSCEVKMLGSSKSRHVKYYNHIYSMDLSVVFQHASTTFSAHHHVQKTWYWHVNKIYIHDSVITARL
jgi:hypothetical protein